MFGDRHKKEAAAHGGAAVNKIRCKTTETTASAQPYKKNGLPHVICILLCADRRIALKIFKCNIITIPRRFFSGANPRGCVRPGNGHERDGHRAPDRQMNVEINCLLQRLSGDLCSMLSQKFNKLNAARRAAGNST